MQALNIISRIYIYIISLHVASEVTFAQNPCNPIWGCELRCCFGTCVSQTGSRQYAEIPFVSVDLCEAKTVSNHVFEPCLQSNHKTLKQSENNPTQINPEQTFNQPLKQP